MPFFPGQAFTTNHPDKCNSLPVSLSTSALNLSSLLKPSKTWTACPVHKTSHSFLNRGLFLLKANKALHEPGVLPTSSVSFFPCPLFHVTSWSNWTTHSDPCAPVASCLSVPHPFSLEWLTSFKSLFFHPLPEASLDSSSVTFLTLHQMNRVSLRCQNPFVHHCYLD